MLENIFVGAMAVVAVAAGILGWKLENGKPDKDVEVRKQDADQTEAHKG
ncbi:MAG: hypothetical protein ACI4AD_13085 [Roseburia sp.]